MSRYIAHTISICVVGRRCGALIRLAEPDAVDPEPILEKKPDPRPDLNIQRYIFSRTIKINIIDIPLLNYKFGKNKLTYTFDSIIIQGGF